MNNNENDNIVTEYKTPMASVIGWLLISFGCIPLMMGISDKNKIALLIGTILVFSGLILIVIGKRKSRNVPKHKGEYFS